MKPSTMRSQSTVLCTMAVLFCILLNGYGQSTLTNEDVLKMVKAGLSPQIILATIKGQPSAFNVTPEAIIGLKNSGVPEEIIAAMVTIASGGSEKTEKTGNEVVIPDGTQVKLRLLKPISSATARIEDRVEFEAAEDIVIKGIVVIKKGAAAQGRVTEAEPKKSFGRRGKLNFTIDSVKAADGQNIRLRTTREAKGDESYGKAGVVTILVGPFGALVKGKDVEIGAGTEYTIYIDGDRTMKLNTGSQ